MQAETSRRVAIVTGAGTGLGRAYALALARSGVRLVVNDLGAEEGSAAAAVTEEITGFGGEAFAAGCSVTDEAGVAAMVAETIARWGRIDILVNNAGILRSRGFARTDLADFRALVDVNLIGAAVCSHAVWEQMRVQGRGRILMTTSEGALYPTPGAAGYAAAKLGLVGLMNSLSVEGAKYDIRVNSIAPAAATQMTADLLPPADFARLTHESVVAAALFLVGEDAPNGAILAAGAGRFERAYISHTRGIRLPDAEFLPERIAAHFDAISDRSGDAVPRSAYSVSRSED
jgi:NAD(P)-dependent dehydrogenase (short-subunit alcohol dehydrogenase family)